MNKLHKRFLSMLLACLFLFFSIPTSVFAGPPDVRTENGTIKFKITSTAATSSIKYRTVGWTVRRDQLCSNTTPKQCGDPRSGQHASFFGPASTASRTGTESAHPRPACHDLLRSQRGARHGRHVESGHGRHQRQRRLIFVCHHGVYRRKRQRAQRALLYAG